MKQSSESVDHESLRERNKREKLERIKRAARELFVEKGFEETTTREISQRAEVGTGTLFLYVKDKEELLALIFREEIERIQEAVFATLPDGGLVDRLSHIFGGYLDFYHANGALARLFIRTVLLLGKDHRQTLSEVDQAFLVRLGMLVGEAQARGEVRADADLPLACFNFFAAYCMTLLVWLEERVPTVEAAKALLRGALAQQVAGLEP